MFDNIIRIIWAILTASFVGLIVYFRKPLKSILYALSDMESLKVWQLEFKRREAMNKVVKDIDIVASKSDSFSGSIAASSSVTGSLSTEPKLMSVRIQELEKEKAMLNKLVLGLATIVASRGTINPELAESIKKVAGQFYKKVLAIDPKSKILENISKVITFSTGDRIGVGEDINVEVVGKDDVNVPDEIPPEELQQSKP